MQLGIFWKVFKFVYYPLFGIPYTGFAYIVWDWMDLCKFPKIFIYSFIRHAVLNVFINICFIHNLLRLIKYSAWGRRPLSVPSFKFFNITSAWATAKLKQIVPKLDRVAHSAWTRLYISRVQRFKSTITDESTLKEKTSYWRLILDCPTQHKHYIIISMTVRTYDATSK
jgi:hypothetical protein